MTPLKPKDALLVLADGTIFRGYSIGCSGVSVGEVVFNTSMTGYQEILTDPSYAKQIVTLTYSHIGNVGVNAEDEESDSIWCSGLVIKDLPALHSSFRSEQSLQEYLSSRNVVGIAGIDTRKLTRVLREKGAQSGCILAVDNTFTEADEIKALSAAKAFPGLSGMDLAKEVTIDKQLPWSQGKWQLGAGFAENADEAKKPFNVIAYDFGVKRNILRLLVDRGCSVTLVPAETPAQAVLDMNPDGIFLSNGPGDPEPCDYAISAIKTFLTTDIPIFGICLGHQLLALAAGASTLKMKFGHHGANHPVQDLKKGNVLITSQNHGFAVDEKSLPANVEATHRSLFDGSLQGIHFTDRPAFSFQGHPEASPGPQEAVELFDHFVELMTASK